MGLTATAANAAEVQWANQRSVDYYAITTSATQPLLTGGRAWLYSSVVITEISTYTTGVGLVAQATASGATATLVHPASTNSFSGCGWDYPVYVSGSIPIDCWYRT